MPFGAFIGPTADDVAAVRERVLAAERAGFDFVSIQDHPYVRPTSTLSPSSPTSWP